MPRVVRTLRLLQCPSCPHAPHDYRFEVIPVGPNEIRRETRLFYCPVTGAALEIALDVTDCADADVQAVSPASPESQAIYAAGRSLLASSPSLTQDFAKTMITVSTGALTLYFAVVKFVIGDKVPATTFDALVLGLPPVAFFAASALFAWAYTPRHRDLQLDVPEQTAAGMSSVAVHRERWNRAGLWLFVAGSLLILVALAYALSTPSALHAAAATATASATK